MRRLISSLFRAIGRSSNYRKGPVPDFVLTTTALIQLADISHSYQTGQFRREPRDDRYRPRGERTLEKWAAVYCRPLDRYLRQRRWSKVLHLLATMVVHGTVVRIYRESQTEAMADLVGVLLPFCGFLPTNPQAEVRDEVVVALKVNRTTATKIRAITLLLSESHTPP